jgi:hypothetical protein
MIDISNLHIGMTIKGYKHMCEVIGDKNKGTDTKGRERQKRNWKRYFNWTEHSRYNWKITEIYDNPKPKVDGRVNNGGARNKKYCDHMDYLILQKCHQNNTLIGTKYELAVKFGLCNERFRQFFPNNERFAEELKIDKRYLWFFYSRVSDKIKTIIFDSVERLKRLGCIDYDFDEYYVKVGRRKPQLMTDEIRNKIIALKNEFKILNEESYFDPFQVKEIDNWYKREKRYKEEMQEQLGIRYTFEVYKILGLLVTDKINELETVYGKDFDHKKVLNQKIVDSIIESAVNYQEKKKLDPFWNVEGKIYTKEYHELKDRNEYIEVMKKCADYFISLN